ncbi:GIY-YIG nuclease family protein [Candidatus Omnitrophota bacterium]
MDKALYNESWFVYIAECRNRTLYVGVAKDTSKRIEIHNKTKQCRYTRYRKPLRLIYNELCSNYKAARSREATIKRFSRKKKLDLVNSK